MPATPLPTPEAPLAYARQLLVVIADDWHSTSATLQRWARPALDAPWVAVGPGMPVSLGRHGLAWGLGLPPADEYAGQFPSQLAAPFKREGDGRAPAGIFALPSLFGVAPADSDEARALRLPYQPAHAALKCVDDPTSRHYDRIVDQTTTAIDWQSAEDMLRGDARYTIGAVIAHNPDHVAGAGSCIFLHVWQAPGVPTAGCTAGERADIDAVCAWLDGDARPLLVQLPAAEYARRRTAWQLP